VGQAQRKLDEAKANLAQQQTQVTLAQQQLDRTSALVPKGFATVRASRSASSTDERRRRRAKCGEPQGCRGAARARRRYADVELYRINILDNTLVAPREGRIQYRVANVGEVLPAGGRVFTILDTSYVYMDIYLPTADAGRVRLGSEARIVQHDRHPSAAPDR